MIVTWYMVIKYEMQVSSIRSQMFFNSDFWQIVWNGELYNSGVLNI